METMELGNPPDFSEDVGALKKGPWTSAEDAILVAYVTKHGEGNWNSVQKHSGLYRCGKSCRLRWANHLRPNLKKGAFTPEEERMIIELHAKLGNKWARMAAQVGPPSQRLISSPPPQKISMQISDHTLSDFCRPSHFTSHLMAWHRIVGAF